jgi:hypothetical protein
VNLESVFTQPLVDSKGEETGKVTFNIKLVVDKLTLDEQQRLLVLSKTMDLSIEEKAQKRTAVIDVMAIKFSEEMLKKVLLTTFTHCLFYFLL